MTPAAPPCPARVPARARRLAFLALGVALGLMACEGQPRSAKAPDAGTTCVPGALGCACVPEARCDAGLRCEAGRCVVEPPACPEGTHGCACAPNAACGAGLVCQDGQCGSDPGPPEGAPGGLCGVGCQGSARCIQGRCQAPGCLEGAEGCACAPQRGCDSAGLVCGAGWLCLSERCEEGLPGCGCGVDGACQGSARCVAGVCRSPARLGLEAPQARACEVLLGERGRAVASVDFARGLIGQSLRRRGQVGLAFRPREGAPQRDSRLLTLTLEGDAPASVEAVALLKIRCRDEAGATISAPGLRLITEEGAPTPAPPAP